MQWAKKPSHAAVPLKPLLFLLLFLLFCRQIRCEEATTGPVVRGHIWWARRVPVCRVLRRTFPGLSRPLPGQGIGLAKVYIPSIYTAYLCKNSSTISVVRIKMRAKKNVWCRFKYGINRIDFSSRVQFKLADRVLTREMENISRGPTFGDFVTILTEGSM